MTKRTWIGPLWNPPVQSPYPLDAERATYASALVEDAPPVGVDPEALFATLAASHKLIPEGETIPLGLWQYTMDIIELCASIGDLYDGEGDENAGEEIRAVYGEPR